MGSIPGAFCFSGNNIIYSIYIYYIILKCPLPPHGAVSCCVFLPPQIPSHQHLERDFSFLQGCQEETGGPGRHPRLKNADNAPPPAGGQSSAAAAAAAAAAGPLLDLHDLIVPRHDRAVPPQTGLQARQLVRLGLERPGLPVLAAHFRQRLVQPGLLVLVLPLDAGHARGVPRVRGRRRVKPHLAPGVALVTVVAAGPPVGPVSHALVGQPRAVPRAGLPVHPRVEGAGHVGVLPLQVEAPAVGALHRPLLVLGQVRLGQPRAVVLGLCDADLPAGAVHDPGHRRERRVHVQIVAHGLELQLERALQALDPAGEPHPPPERQPQGLQLAFAKEPTPKL
mmetsp:Transcript_12620/g.22495  ORF Transcript_12620/g.22495 Transcript_12620/m.22495 type:complete len:338 (-) Transcript_12620:463-1476(-)